MNILTWIKLDVILKDAFLLFVSKPEEVEGEQKVQLELTA